MLKYEINGYFSDNECKRIVEVLEGVSYFRFHIEYGGMAGNNSIIVTSQIKDHTDEDLKNMFIFCALSRL